MGIVTWKRAWSLGLLAPALLVAAWARPSAAVAQRPAAHATRASEAAVFAGGCYWGVESVFRHVRGVVSATSGYSFPAPAPGLRSTGRAESVRIVYDPARISYRQILTVFFSVAHDPTQLDRQGPDVGPEYRSLVFVSGDRQRGAVRAYIDSLSAAHVFSRPIVTEIAALRAFRPVVASQQDYAAKHPTDPYIVENDVPKLEALQRQFPQLYRN